MAIGGAFALLGTTWLLNARVERAAVSSGQASVDYRRVEAVIATSHELLAVTDFLDAGSASVLEMLERQAERCRSILDELEQSPTMQGTDIVARTREAFEAMVAEASAMVAGGDRGPRARRRLGLLKGPFRARLEALQSLANRRASAETLSLIGRRALTFWITIGLGAAYLVVIVVLQRWAARSVVRPIQALARATSASGARHEPFTLEESGPTEVRTLTRSVAAFVRSLQDEIGVRRAAEQKLQHDAMHDALTDLPNRAMLMKRLRRCIERSTEAAGARYALLFLDLDNFKVINDSLGHIAGDRLLVEAAERLSGALRRCDVTLRGAEAALSRLGGDEFVILLEGIREVADAFRAAASLQEALMRPFTLRGHEVAVSASIGIALGDRETRTPDDLLRAADTAMYRAKLSGKARHAVYDEAMHRQVMARLKLENSLRWALERRQFRIRYQPIVALRTAEVEGFEALVRWKHPTQGMIDPTRFVPVAEESGIIIPIGRWILQEACMQLVEWKRRLPRGRRLSVNVNVSGRQVAEPGLVEDVQRTLKETGLEPECLQLEITEGMIMAAPEAVNDTLSELRRTGVGLQMDDFGTGFSSLSSLHQFPLDVLKIDRSFMNFEQPSREQASVVHAIVTLAHNLDLLVTAEGVETSDQLANVLALDCDYGQGYLFAPAVDPEKAWAMLEDRPRWLESA